MREIRAAATRGNNAINEKNQSTPVRLFHLPFFDSSIAGCILAGKVLIVSFLIFSFAAAQTQNPIRLAILDLPGDDRGELATLLRELASQAGFELINEDLTIKAARGAGYRGSLNLSRDEARALGQSLGCEFYILGKAQVARRLATGEEFYFEALAGLFTIEARTGRLIRFRFERARTHNEQESYRQLKELVKAGWGGSVDAIFVAQEKHAHEIKNVIDKTGPVKEILIDDAEGSGIEQPVFYQRIKPAYTDQAELAGIAATVELEAVFGEDGQVGNVEVVRWAGFGLDESAMSAVRSLRYKPAERDGKRLTIRGLVRYNFRRPIVQAAQPQAQSREELERLKRSLRDILRPGRKP
jgi:TonB family protein